MKTKLIALLGLGAFMFAVGVAWAMPPEGTPAWCKYMCKSSSSDCYKTCVADL